MAKRNKHLTSKPLQDLRAYYQELESQRFGFKVVGSLYTLEECPTVKDLFEKMEKISDEPWCP
jgi:hypothetical protein